MENNIENKQKKDRFINDTIQYYSLTKQVCYYLIDHGIKTLNNPDEVVKIRNEIIKNTKTKNSLFYNESALEESNTAEKLAKINIIDLSKIIAKVINDDKKLSKKINMQR